MVITSEDAWRESTSSWENWTGVPLYEMYQISDVKDRTFEKVCNIRNRSSIEKASIWAAF